MYEIIKRFFDIVISAFLICLFLPLSILIAIMIKVEDGGHIFFIQKRMGIGGKTIRIIKFRSMKEQSDDLVASLSLVERELYYKEYKLQNDPRVTKVGSYIRKACLDEIPQLLSAFLGDLSIVGPRPILKEESHFYSSEHLKEFLSVKPGITGYWQTFGRNIASYSDGTRQDCEMYYVKNKSFVLDAKIILKTISIILSEILK